MLVNPVAAFVVLIITARRQFPQNNGERHYIFIFMIGLLRLPLTVNGVTQLGVTQSDGSYVSMRLIFYAYGTFPVTTKVVNTKCPRLDIDEASRQTHGMLPFGLNFEESVRALQSSLKWISMYGLFTIKPVNKQTI